MSEHQKTVAIIGAGPVGLAAAAHALERGLKPIVLEAGPDAAHAVRQWGHVRMFSPWEYNVNRAAGRLLAATGWNSPDPKHYPTGAELVERYLEPLATRTPLKDAIQTSSRVTAISRAGFDKVKTKGREQAPFELRYQNGAGPKTLLADAVIDASGTWSSPNAAGANGLEAVGETEAQERIAYAMPDVLGRDRSRYAGKTVAVMGSGHSAVGTLIDLVRLKDEAPQTQVLWLLRGNDPEKAFGGGTNDKLAARGELGAAFARLVGEGRIVVEPGFRVQSLSMQDGSSDRRRRRVLRPSCPGGRVDRRRWIPPRPLVPAGIAHRARSCARMSTNVGAAHRSQRAQLRHRAAAWRARTGAARGRLLLRGHEVVWPGADLPDAYRLRAGPLDRGRHRGRPRSGRAGRACPAGDRRLQRRCRGGERANRLLRRTGQRRRHRMLRGRRSRQSERRNWMRM
jgi:thioredoxin reductase